MANLRGLGVLNTLHFVEQHSGPSAHSSVLEALSPSQGAALQGPIRESSWRPLAPVLAYMDWEATLEHRPEFGFLVRELACRVQGDGFCEWKATWVI